MSASGQLFAGINNGNVMEAANIFAQRASDTCSKWNRIQEKRFINADLRVLAGATPDPKHRGVYQIRGSIHGSFTSLSAPLYVKYWAASPPDYLSNFSGSALPYPNEEVAFENTPNKGVVEIRGGLFEFRLHYPNSYYVDMGSKYVKPQVKLILVNAANEQLSALYEINLGNGVPYRTLDYTPLRNWSEGPLFFQNVPLVTTQENILRNSAYPATNKVPANFWGFKPPM
jgi:hypothetical protein